MTYNTWFPGAWWAHNFLPSLKRWLSQAWNTIVLIVNIVISQVWNGSTVLWQFRNTRDAMFDSAGSCCDCRSSLWRAVHGAWTHGDQSEARAALPWIQWSGFGINRFLVLFLSNFLSLLNSFVSLRLTGACVPNGPKAADRGGFNIFKPVQMASWINESTSRTDLNCDRKAVGEAFAMSMPSHFSRKSRIHCFKLSSVLARLIFAISSAITPSNLNSCVGYPGRGQPTMEAGPPTQGRAALDRCWNLTRKRKQRPNCQGRTARWQEGEGNMKTEFVAKYWNSTPT